MSMANSQPPCSKPSDSLNLPTTPLSLSRSRPVAECNNPSGLVNSMNPIAATILGTMKGKVLRTLSSRCPGHLQRPNMKARGTPMMAVAIEDIRPISIENETASLVCLRESRSRMESRSPSSATSSSRFQASKKGITMTRMRTTAGIPSHDFLSSTMIQPQAMTESHVSNQSSISTAILAILISASASGTAVCSR